MHVFLGCLFAFVFGCFLFVVGITRLTMRTLFGWLWPNQNPQRPASSNQRTQQTAHPGGARTTSGNAHREGNRYGAQPEGKIFGKDEGQYVDFEEVSDSNR